MNEQDFLEWLARNPQARNVLEQLHDARRAARAMPADVWTQAVEMATLMGMGCTNVQLRMLVWADYVDHAEEMTNLSEASRTFHPEPRMKFGPRSCFVLTEEGSRFVSTLDEESDIPKRPGHDRPRRRVPRWSATARELRVDGRVLKRFKRPAPITDLLLAAFEEMGWPRHLDDPLPPENGIDTQQRLHDTIKRLNACQEPQLIRFVGDGTGSGVKWEWVSAGNGMSPG